MNEQITSYSETEQGSLAWHRARLGIITSSCLGNLTGKIKRDKEGKIIVPPVFSATAMSYLHKKAAERGLRRDIIDDDIKFEQYLEEDHYQSKAMRLGSEREELARWVYAKRTKQEVQTVGLQKYKNLFGDSPDGVVLLERTCGTLEIKCPGIGVHNKYCTLTEQSQLLEMEQDYYLQCQGHLLANNAEWCDFVSFSPLQIYDMHILRLLPDLEIQEYISELTRRGNEIIESLTRK